MLIVWPSDLPYEKKKLASEPGIKKQWPNYLSFCFPPGTQRRHWVNAENTEVPTLMDSERTQKQQYLALERKQLTSAACSQILTQILFNYLFCANHRYMGPGWAIGRVKATGTPEGKAPLQMDSGKPLEWLPDKANISYLQNTSHSSGFYYYLLILGFSIRCHIWITWHGGGWAFEE